MPSHAYRTIEPEPETALWRKLEHMAAHRYKQLSRICAAISALETDPRRVCADSRTAGLRIAPPEGYWTVEAYLVPSMYDDAAALVAVNHDVKTIEFLEIYENLLSPEDDEAQWRDIKDRATSRARK